MLMPIFRVKYRPPEKPLVPFLSLLNLASLSQDILGKRPLLNAASVSPAGGAEGLFLTWQNDTEQIPPQPLAKRTKAFFLWFH